MKKDLWKKLSRRRRKWALWSLGILLFYGIVGAILLPPIARHIAVKQLSQQLGRDVSIQKIRIHPFDGSVTVRDLLIKDPDGSPFVSWDTVHVNFQLTSLLGKTYTFREISTTRPAVHVKVNPDGTFNFSDILARLSTNAPPAPGPKPASSKLLAVRINRIRVDGFDLSLENHRAMTNAATTGPAPVATTTNAVAPEIALLRSITNALAQFAAATNQLNAVIDNVLVTNGAVHFQDLATARPAKLNLTDITLTAKNISNVPAAEMTADLSLHWNKNGSIGIFTSGSLQKTLVVKLDLDQLDFGTLDPYLDPQFDLFVLGSQFGLHGAATLAVAENQLPHLSFAGDVRLDALHTVDGVMVEDLLNWDSIHASGIFVTADPAAIAIREIAINSSYARVIVESNKTVNLLNALRLTMPVADTNETPAVAQAPPPAGAPLPKITVGAVTISNAAISFTDRSLSPNVNLRIEHAGGSISGISSEDGRPATVSLNAAVDGVGPVTITGTLNPFSGTLKNSITISVKDVDLTPTGPYSAKFAGYRIAKGKLNLDLEYEWVGKKLDSKNVITLDQFTFGEQVDSPEATHLPVRLAINILKDRDGKIILDVPVQGSFDDPKFRIGKVIRRTLMNILEKVATSPFALVGAVFGGGGEELGYQEFVPGDTTLTAEDVKKLDVLAKALYDRPGLQLEIAGSVDPNGDREGLQRIRLDKQIRTQIWMGQRRAGRSTNNVDEIPLPADVRERWIKKFYGQAIADGKITPQLVAADTNLAVYAAGVLPKTKSLKGATQLVSPTTTKAASAPAPAYQTKLVPSPTPMEAVLLATLPVDDNDLGTLAADRAKAVQGYLLQTGKVDASRLFLKENGARQDGSRVYLQFR